MKRKIFLMGISAVSILSVVFNLCLGALFPVTTKAASFANGADVSWLPQMEAKGYKFYDDYGVEKDCLQILKEHGINSIRLRVWVNPSNDPYNGRCSKDDVVKMAKRCKDMGFRIMINFHYSDSWADPGQQNKPSAWANHSTNQLYTDIYNYTYDVLSALKSNGVTPEWVKVGNETNNGMLWDDGKASVNMRNFAWMINSGYDAVKAIFPQTKVIVHLSNGHDNSLFRWMFDGLKSNGARYDVIGMSLYPQVNNWVTQNNQCFNNMNDMVSRYGKEIMICEVGMDNTAPGATKEMVTDLLKKVASVQGGKGLGVFYWEPQSYDWSYYNKGAWSTNGRPTIALDAFLSNNSGLPISTPTPTMTPTPIATTPKPTNNDYMCGDINGDKDVNSLDFALLRNYLLGFNQLPYENGLKAADVNGDNQVNSLDFAIMRMYLLGVIKSLPVGA